MNIICIILIFYDLKTPKVFDFTAYKHIDEEELSQIPISDQYTREITSKEVVHRQAGCWTYWGWKKNFFVSMVTKTF